MKLFLTQVFLAFFFLSLSTSCTDKDDHTTIDETEVVNQDFNEGVIEFGMYTMGVDLGYLVGKIDFSRDDVYQQWEELIEDLPSENNLIDLINELSQENPLLALGVIMNSVVFDYYIKGDQVLGVGKGFGYDYDNYHDMAQNQGKLYLKTHVNHPQILEEDRELSIQYSLDNIKENMGVTGNLSIDMFDRETTDESKNILGYEANLTVYNLKDEFRISPPEDGVSNPLGTLQVHKINVYTSKQFSKTLNFSHPYYLPEEDGIIELEVFFEENTDIPTMVMKPEKIEARTIRHEELQIRINEPVYDYSDPSWPFKAMGIMMSGWGAITDE